MSCNTCRGVCRCNSDKIQIHAGINQRIKINCGLGLNGCSIEPEFVKEVKMTVRCKCCPAVIAEFHTDDFDLNHQCDCHFQPMILSTAELPVGTFHYEIIVTSDNETVLAQSGDFVVKHLGG
mgnify:CR=1 FL=1